MIIVLIYLMVKELLLLCCRKKVEEGRDYSKLQFNWRDSVRWLLERPSGNKTYCSGRSKMKVHRSRMQKICVCVHYCVRCIAITVRNPKRLLGHRRIFIQRASLEMWDQIRSRDVRSKYTYSPARALRSSFFLFPVSLFRFNFDSKYVSQTINMTRYIKLPEVITIYNNNDIAFRKMLFSLLFQMPINV